MTQKSEIKRIIVVDDELSICSMLTRFLLSNGYDCESTTDPINALEIIMRGDFELLISDIRMAGIDGLQLLDEVSKIDAGLDTIIMTGHTNVYTYSDIIKAGAADFITKPFQTPELKAKIERIDHERKMRRELQEMNVAMGVLLQRSEREKDELRTGIISNVDKLIFPYLDKLKSQRLSTESRAYIEALETNLFEICSPFMKNLSQKHSNLSPMEVQVASLIKAGKENKEIAEILGVSVNTIMTHRYHLRTKLGVKGESVNLRSYLNSVDL